MLILAHVLLHAIFVLCGIALIMACAFLFMVAVYVVCAPGKPDPEHRSSRRD